MDGNINISNASGLSKVSEVSLSYLAKKFDFTTLKNYEKALKRGDNDEEKLVNLRRYVQGILAIIHPQNLKIQSLTTALDRMIDRGRELIRATGEYRAASTGSAVVSSTAVDMSTAQEISTTQAMNLVNELDNMSAGDMTLAALNAKQQITRESESISAEYRVNVEPIIEEIDQQLAIQDLPSLFDIYKLVNGDRYLNFADIPYTTQKEFILQMISPVNPVQEVIKRLNAVVDRLDSQTTVEAQPVPIPAATPTLNLPTWQPNPGSIPEAPVSSMQLTDDSTTSDEDKPAEIRTEEAPKVEMPTFNPEKLWIDIRSSGDAATIIQIAKDYMAYRINSGSERELLNTIIDEINNFDAEKIFLRTTTLNQGFQIPVDILVKLNWALMSEQIKRQKQIIPQVQTISQPNVGVVPTLTNAYTMPVRAATTLPLEPNKI